MGVEASIDEAFMTQALAQAQLAAEREEVPVGAVLVYKQEVLAASFNQPISSQDPTAHAEIMVLREAAKKLNNYRLPDCDLYVTLEPCTMCVGAMVHARIRRLIFGATEPKAGAIHSQAQFLESDFFNHRFEVTAGVLAEECGLCLSQFFQKKRARKKTGHV